MGATEPLVCCVCLTADRQELTERAVLNFEAQTYPRKWMLVYDTGKREFTLDGFGAILQDSCRKVSIVREAGGRSIGALRNAANALLMHADIIAHVDSDDWSHPNRLTEQVALLQSSGADAVGYNEMLFWRNQLWDGGPGAAWLYSNPRPNYALGTSLCYWRKTWERSPFTDGPKPEGTSEYHHWFKQDSGVNVRGVSGWDKVTAPCEGVIVTTYESDPRMIARIHGKNFGAYDIEKQIAGGSREWKRVPAWDARVRSILEDK